MQCHAKQTSDFVFQGACSSLFCSAGHSTDSRNVALWDTLMPQKRALVQSFIFHESGASAVVHAPQHQQLVTGGKRGQVGWINKDLLHCICRIRRRFQNQSFHLSPLSDCRVGLASAASGTLFPRARASGQMHSHRPQRGVFRHRLHFR